MRCTAREMPAILHLLDSCGLPTDDVNLDLQYSKTPNFVLMPVLPTTFRAVIAVSASGVKCRCYWSVCSAALNLQSG